MGNDNLNMKKEDFDNLFDTELKNYLELEKNIWDFMEVYRTTPDENLKNILLAVIEHAKKENYHLLGLISDYFTGKLKVDYSNKLGVKLNDLHEIEEELYGKVRK